ncbi:hypothetical protein ACHAXM_011609 [Skeletonema potamos]
MMPPSYSNLESGSPVSFNGTASRRVSASTAASRGRSTSPTKAMDGTINKTRRPNRFNGVIANPLRLIDRRNNRRDGNKEIMCLSLIRFVLALLITIWFGAMVKLVLNLSKSSPSNSAAEQSAALQELGERWKGLRFDNDGTIHGVEDPEGSEETIAQPAASIFELSLFGNTSPKDFKLTTPHAPSCSDPLDADAVSFTLVSQLSHDRIWMVPYHCKRWGNNPMSIVIFSDKDAAAVKKRLVNAGCSEENLTVQTVSRTKYDPQGSDYPVNVLRNLAFSKVKTSHLVYADIDFWPSESLHSILNIQSVKERMASDSKLATVVPVFQLNRRCSGYKDCPEQNIPSMPNRKERLISLIKRREASTFDPTNEGGHGSTRYISWKQQEMGSFFDLPCIRSNRYEPYLVVRYCSELPPFQEGFSGYGKNKMTWAMQLRRSGYMFSQLGEAFLVHYPHLDSKSRMEWNKKPQELVNVHSTLVGNVLEDKGGSIDLSAFKRARVDALFLDYKDWLRENVEDVSRVPMCDNALNDDVRLWVHREDSESGSEDLAGRNQYDDVAGANEELARDTGEDIANTEDAGEDSAE